MFWPKNNYDIYSEWSNWSKTVSNDLKMSQINIMVHSASLFKLDNFYIQLPYVVAEGRSIDHLQDTLITLWPHLTS